VLYCIFLRNQFKWVNKACQFDIRFLARGQTFKRLASFKHECLRGAGGADQSGWRAKGGGVRVVARARMRAAVAARSKMRRIKGAAGVSGLATWGTRRKSPRRRPLLGGHHSALRPRMHSSLLQRPPVRADDMTAWLRIRGTYGWPLFWTLWFIVFEVCVAGKAFIHHDIRLWENKTCNFTVIILQYFTRRVHCTTYVVLIGRLSYLTQIKSEMLAIVEL